MPSVDIKENIMSVNEVPEITNPEDRKKLLDAIHICTSSKVRMAAERDLIKETVGAVCKELDIPKKVVNKMINVFYKQNYDEEVAVQDQFETLYTTVVNGNND